MPSRILRADRWWVSLTAYQDEQLRFLDTRRIQADEIWSFVYAKAKNVPEEKRDTFGYGDVWTWTALDADTKLTSGHVKRSPPCSTRGLTLEPL